MATVMIRVSVLALVTSCAFAAFGGIAGAGDDTATTTTSIELGPATSVTRAPASPPNDIEVEGKQVVADDRGTSWGWWMLLLIALPALGVLFGLTRKRFAGIDERS